VWGYGQVLILGAIAAIGAGLRVVAYVVEGHAAVGVTGAIVAVTVPALVFPVTLFAVNTYLLREVDPFRAGLVAGSVAILVLAIGVAAAGASIGWCLILVTVAPAVVVVGDKTIGYRRGAASAKRTVVDESGTNSVRVERDVP